MIFCRVIRARAFCPIHIRYTRELKTRNINKLGKFPSSIEHGGRETAVRRRPNTLIKHKGIASCALYSRVGKRARNVLPRVQTAFLQRQFTRYSLGAPT